MCIAFCVRVGIYFWKRLDKGENDNDSSERDSNEFKQNSQNDGYPWS